MHKIILQEQHKAFVTVRNNLKKAKKRQARYADKNAKVVDFEIGDLSIIEIIEGRISLT